MTKFDELRDKYSSFRYNDYHIDFNSDSMHITYDFEIPGLCVFHPAWNFPLPEGSHIESDDNILKTLVFSLGMAETISYYKAVCPKSVVVACAPLTDFQKKWWEKLYYNGLGEFMYRNGIEISEDELVTVESTAGTSERLHDLRSYDGFLVPVGGGKDSVVSLELLKNENIETVCIDGTAGTSSINAVIDICDHKQGSYRMKRTLDRKLIELNKEGFLNGHTPFSAIVAFSTVIAAYITGRKYIALSNETSANESTVPGSFVNHQYSKSLEFEQDFDRYFESVTDSDIHYFSFLRPLTEIQIAAIFSGFTKYHMAFRSCNRGAKEGIWCGNCPKCLFVYIILSPFLSEDELVSIFGEKLLDKDSLDKDFRELTGIDENKPFECVGTRSEVMVALKSFVSSGGRSLLTDRYRAAIMDSEGTLDDMMQSWCVDNDVPQQYQGLIREALTKAREKSAGSKI